MFTSLRGRILLILAVLAISGWQLYSNGVKLGLDLQGGMHLALEVEDPQNTLTDAAKADMIDRAERIIRTRVDELGVEEPLIQKAGQERLVVELAGIGDEDRAKDILNRAAFLEFKLVVPTAEMDRALPRIDRVLVTTLGEEELRQMGVSESTGGAAAGPSVEEVLFGRGAAPSDTAAAAAAPDSAAGADSAAAEEAAGDSLAAAELRLRPFSALLQRGDIEGTYFVAEENVERLQRFLAMPEVDRALPRGIALNLEADPIVTPAGQVRRLYVLESDAIMTGEALQDAVAVRDAQFNQAQVQFQLTRRAGQRFAQVTGQHVGDYLAIVLDEQVMSAPVIRDRIGARGQIELGAAPLEEARDLALLLRAGALPARLTVVEERTVGPSLGQDSIDEGVVAGAIGLVFVVAVMIGFYRFAGGLAVTALGGYVLVLLGALAALGASLTLPGLAGLILSIGMAVDSNVLIFERIREELDRGRTTKTAVDEGFTMAFSAIVDSNLTTLLAGLVLFQFGTGPVRGFAVTLCIGIIASFFSAIYVTRTLFMLYLRRRAPSDPLNIGRARLMGGANYQYIEKRRVAYMVSGAMIAVGLVAMLWNTATIGSWLRYGVDFSGGTLIQVEFAQPTAQADILEALGGPGSATVTQFGEAYEYVIRAGLAEGVAEEAQSQAIEDALTAAFGADAFEVVRTELVGPTIGAELQRTALIAMVLSFMLTLIYLAIRFEFRFGLAAVIATAHDILLTLCFLALFRVEILLPTIAAILTIVGYSLNDTIVVFDRIRENLKSKGAKRESAIALINRSINETLPRTLMTGISVLGTLLALLVFGPLVLREFALVMFLGIIAGTYSSIFIGSPALIEIQNRWGQGELRGERDEARPRPATV
jgi:SecD/SecF fusion protein